jgi:predicted transcriptional regulator
MTGRDLIVYIVTNGLEDKPVFEDGKFVGFLTVGEAAVKFGTGNATIQTYYLMGMLDGFVIGGELYIPATADIKHLD